jgi:hypothetical protein
MVAAAEPAVPGSAKLPRSEPRQEPLPVDDRPHHPSPGNFPLALGDPHLELQPRGLHDVEHRGRHDACADGTRVQVVDLHSRADAGVTVRESARGVPSTGTSPLPSATAVSS